MDDIKINTLKVGSLVLMPIYDEGGHIIERQPVVITAENQTSVITQASGAPITREHLRRLGFKKLSEDEYYKRGMITQSISVTFDEDGKVLVRDRNQQDYSKKYGCEIWAVSQLQNIYSDITGGWELEYQ